ncbi:hypothetical protein BofuT4_uP131090.1 [Botrytis cinerea T4]|uniref:Uncharacterized protein n=1 Tax=Botryotinia fuckeliana (strain T4) TaxID=999810 RepID=G2YQN1_BOTF4|nr:hypothetical protein BofuT4_uP131090.1 [Botrytis cinerea T4]
MKRSMSTGAVVRNCFNRNTRALSLSVSVSLSLSPPSYKSAKFPDGCARE